MRSEKRSLAINEMKEVLWVVRTEKKEEEE